MKPDEATRKKRGFSLSFLSVQAFPLMRFFFWTDSPRLPLIPPSIPSTHPPLDKSGLDGMDGVRVGAGAGGDSGAVGRCGSVRRRWGRCGAVWRGAGGRFELGEREAVGLPSLEANNAELSTLPRWGGINLKGECYE